MSAPSLSIGVPSGAISLVSRARDADALRQEAQKHFDRIVGSQGLGREAIGEKYGAMRLRPCCLDGDRVEIMVTGDDGTGRPVGADDLAPCELPETALGYAVARMAHRGLLDFDQLRTPASLPNGRRLTDLRPVAISLMPKNVLLALAELHTIGFTGTPPDLGTVRLRLGTACELETTATDPAPVLAEIEELQRRCAEKFDLARGGQQRYGSAELPAYIEEANPQSVVLDIEEADPANARSVTLQWVLVHLLRPRRPSVYFPMRPWVLLPRSITQAPPLSDGRRLADLPAVRNQLVPPKIALHLQRLHLRGNAAMADRQSPSCEMTIGGCRIPVFGLSARDTARQLESIWQTSRAALDEDVGSATKYDPITLRLRSSDQEVRVESDRLAPGSPDDLFLELAIASLAQSGHLSRDDLRAAPPISAHRRLLDWPALQRQIVPMETVDLVENVHSGQRGLERNESGWKALRD